MTSLSGYGAGTEASTPHPEPAVLLVATILDGGHPPTIRRQTGFDSPGRGRARWPRRGNGPCPASGVPVGPRVGRLTQRAKQIPSVRTVSTKYRIHNLGDAGQAQHPVPSHSTYVIVHGAWGGSWDWHLVGLPLPLPGATTCTGLPLPAWVNASHPASPAIGLATHIEDVVNTILWRTYNSPFSESRADFRLAGAHCGFDIS